MWRIVPVAAISLACLVDVAGAGEMAPPRITRVAVDWTGAAAKLNEIAALQVEPVSADTPAQTSAINLLNRLAGDRLPDIAHSPIPVLLPFDVEAYVRDRIAVATLGSIPVDPDRASFFGFGQPAFFAAGPAGYDATFRFSVSNVPGLANIRFGEQAEIAITGSWLVYELDAPLPEGVGVPALEADFPGIRRLMLENHVRYTFVRYGVPYVVSTVCFDAPSARYHRIACRDADRLIERFIASLRIAGGVPQPAQTAFAPPAVERPAAASPTFTYYSPGRLVPGTGYRGHDGRADTTAYSAIRFPLAEAPAFANTQYYQRRVAGGVAISPWRDNFCESRSFGVTQCPGGFGHQGQDIRAPDCAASVGDGRCSGHEHDIVAVRNGTIMRTPGHEAMFLVVNTANEHIRFRYLHMRPKLLDAARMLSGRRVTAGELIGQIGNFSQHENGTSYHLHFDIQVPTRAGWIYVNPYMTLVSAYERLIGGRGAEIATDVVASANTTMNDAGGPGAITLAAVQHAILGTPMASSAAVAAPQVAPTGCVVRYWRGRARRDCRTAIATQPVVGGQQRGSTAPAHGRVIGASAAPHRHYRRHRS